jgi:hypothetical protein
MVLYNLELVLIKIKDFILIIILKLNKMILKEWNLLMYKVVLENLKIWKKF